MNTMVVGTSTELSKSMTSGIGVLLIVLFAVDLSLPLGVAAGVPYLVVVLWSKELNGRDSILIVGAVCSGLTVAGYFLSPVGGEGWKVLVNRGLALFAIWATAILCIRWKEAEIELRHRAENLQAMVDLIPHMIYVRDPVGRIVMANQKTAEVFGVRQKELVASLRGFVGVNAVEEAARRRAEDEVRHLQITVVTSEEVVTDSKGTTSYCHTTRLPYRTDGSAGISVLTVAIDQTQQRQAQQSLLLTKQVFETSPDHIAVVDRHYRYQRVNPAYERNHKVSSEKMHELHVADVLGEDAFQTVVKPNLDRCFAGEEITYESWIDFKHSGRRYLHVTYTPLMSAAHMVDGAVVVARDLTATRQMERKLVESEERYRSLVQQVPFCIHEIDVSGQILSMNPAGQKMIGIEDETEIIGSPYLDLMEPKDHERGAQYFAQACQGQQVEFEFQVLNHGHPKYYIKMFTPVRDASGLIVSIMGIAEDITERKKFETELRDSEQRLALALEATNSGTWDWNIQTGEVVLGRHWLRSMGYEGHESQQSVSFWEGLVHPEDMPKVRDALTRHFSGETAMYECRNRLRCADGLWRWNLDQGKVVEWSLDGKPVRMVGTDTDISSRVQAEEASQEFERLASSTMEALSAHICVIDGHGTIVAINRRWRDFAEANCGWHDHFGVGSNYLSVCDREAAHGNEDAQVIGAGIRSVLSKQEKKFFYDYDCHSSREKRWFSCRVTRFPDPGPLRIVITHENITTLKLTQATLYNRIQETQDLYNNAPCGYHSLDDSGRYVEVNDTELRWLGYTREDLLGCSVIDVLTPASQQQFREVFSQFLESGSISNLEADFRRKDGTTLSVLVNATAIRNDAGEFIRSRATILDVSERKKANELLKKWATVFEHVEWGVAVSLGVSADFEMMNRAYAQMHGYNVEELVGQPIVSVFAPESREKLLEIVQPIHEKGHLSFESTHLKKDGSTFPALVTVSAIKDSQGDVLYRVANVIDISLRKQAEDALRNSQITLQSFFDSAPLMMGIVELEGEDIRHISDNVATGIFFEVDVCNMKNQLSSQLGMPLEFRELWIRQCQESLRLRESVRFEYAHRQHEKMYWLAAVVTHIDSPESQFPRFAYVIEDITIRKQMQDELQRYTDGLEDEVVRRSRRIQELEQRRMQMEKLAALAQVAAGVAHEVNNPLASIAQSMVLLTRAIPPDHEHFHYTEKIQDCIVRISHIVKQLFNLYRPDAGRQENVNIVEIVNDTMSIMTSIASKRSVSIVSRLPTSPIEVRGSRVNLTQVFCNLLQNAIDASQPDQTIWLELSSEPNQVTISVHDEGAGIQVDDRGHVFEPFFTTKHGSDESGMGLGLAVSQSLAASMGGNIEFTSIEGEGSIFCVQLPKGSEAGNEESWV